MAEPIALAARIVRAHSYSVGCSFLVGLGVAILAFGVADAAFPSRLDVAVAAGVIVASMTAVALLSRARTLMRQAGVGGRRCGSNVLRLIVRGQAETLFVGFGAYVLVRSVIVALRLYSGSSQAQQAFGSNQASVSPMVLEILVYSFAVLAVVVWSIRRICQFGQKLRADLESLSGRREEKGDITDC